MKKALLTNLILFISLACLSQTRDTLSAKFYQFPNITMEDRMAPDSVNFSRRGDTLVISENKWKGYPSKPMAIIEYVKDSLVISLSDTGAVLAASGRFLTTIKVPGAFKTSDAIKLHFEGKNYNVVIFITNLSNTEISSETKVYPNPAKEKVFIEVPNGFNSLAIFNALGEKMNVIHPSSSEINLSGYTSGVYYISIFTNSGVIKRSFLKE